MNQCDEFRGDFDAYRDQSLDQQRSEQVEMHLNECANCRQQFDHDVMIEAELKTLASNWTVSEGLWSRIRESVTSEKQTTKPKRFGQRWVAAAVFLFAFGFMVSLLPGINQETPSNDIAKALVSEFHTFVISNRALDYTNNQPSEIRQWFGSKVDFSVPLPIEAPSTVLAGGRLCNMFEQRLVSFMYKYDDVWVSLYIKKLGDENAQAIGNELAFSGYGFIDWQDQGLHYSLVGDVPAKKLRAIAIALGAHGLTEV